MALDYARANIVPSGISSWKLRESGQTEFWTLPFLKDAKVMEKTLTTLGSTGRQHPYAVELTASAKMLAINELTLMELFDDLGTLDFDHQITMQNGQTWDTSLLSTGFGGLKWKLVCDANMDDVMHLEVEMDRRLTLGEEDTIHGAVGASTADVGTCDDISTLTLADIGVAGIAKVELGEGSYSNTMSALNGGSFTAELLTERDSLGRSKGYAIKIDYDVNCFQADDTDVDDLDTLAGYDIDTKITMVNGRVWTMDSMLGFHSELTFENDMDGTSFIKVQGGGKILPASWDGIIT
jgi:hypothetical protein